MERRIALKIMMMLGLLGCAFLSSVKANVFDIPPSSTWTKVQDGEITQWSIIPQGHQKTRIDLLIYTEDDERKTLFLIRSFCPENSEIVSAVIKPGNKLGIGLSCNGELVVKTATILLEVQNKLPVEVLKLLE